jgi:iron-sulfur cluster assembly protein|tara:strand:- start:488 stop:811 length:324 start_codon:yes stop_codon:yes gene_type:complete
MLYLTDSAKSRVKHWLAENSSKSIRIAMKTAGCTGLMYEVVLGEDFDIMKDFALKQDGFDVLIANDYLHAINGATLDYITEGFNSHFELVNNPNETARCGCGESFTV